MMPAATTHGFSGEGYLVCDTCAFLAHLPADVTLN